MKHPFIVRSIIFDILFYTLTGISCLVLLPTLLAPRKYFLLVVRYFVYTTAILEKYVLGLDFEIRGLENLPDHGSFLIAAKHQSAYETTKLHLLFDDPAIVLKKELLKIPLWGWYLAKSDVIAIDRSTPKNAVKSIQDGARRMMAQNRPIIIFPQGTRVFTNTTTVEKPYKIGIARMQESTGLPIIPLALNSGVFWSRGAIFKKPGRVIFEFLPAIAAGGDAAQTLAKLENEIEQKSNALIKEGHQSIPNPDKANLYLIAGLIFLFIAWTINWYVAASLTRDAVHKFITDLNASDDFAGSTLSDPKITGYPFKLKLDFKDQKIRTKNQTIIIDDISAKSWPFLNFPITIKATKISILLDSWSAPLTYDEFRSKFIYTDDLLDLKYAHLKKEDFEGVTSGNIVFSKPYPQLDLVINLKNHETILTDLIRINAIKPKAATIAGITLASLKTKDGVTLKLTSQDKNVYLGPIKIYQFPDVEIEHSELEDGSSSTISTKRAKPASP